MQANSHWVVSPLVGTVVLLLVTVLLVGTIFPMTAGIADGFSATSPEDSSDTWFSVGQHDEYVTNTHEGGQTRGADALWGTGVANQ